MEFNGRPVARFSEHFYIAPANAVVPSGAQGFHGSFLGGKSGRISLNPVRLGIAISNFAICEDAANKPLTETLNGFCDARYFGYINSGANNHCDNLAQELE